MTPAAGSQPFYVRDILVEPSALRLTGKNTTCQIEPKVMALLVALAERPGQTWQRDELFPRLWPQANPSDEALTRLVYQARKAFRQVGVTGRLLQTISKLGYRLDGDVEYAGAADRPTQGKKTAPPFSVAVLPVVDVSTDGSGQLLAAGLTRDITALLARTPNLWVAAYSSASRISSPGADMASIGEALHVRHLVTTTLARYEETVRIRVDLSDAAHGRLLWSQKYDTGFDRFFEIQEEVVCRITTAIAAGVNMARPLRIRVNGRFSLTAYERVQRAEALRVDYGPQTARQIVALLEEALEIEPDDPTTRAALAVQLSQNVVSQWTHDPDQTRLAANNLIAEALASAPDHPDVRASAGILAAMFHRPDEAINHLEVAIARNPNDAHAMAVLGWQHCLRHADAGGIGLIEAAESRAPHHPRFGLWATYRATSHLFMLDYDDALIGAKQAIERTPRYYQPHLTCAWAHAGLGDERSARRQVRIAQEMEGEAILARFIEEMRAWSANSPNKEACWRALEAIPAP